MNVYRISAIASVTLRDAIRSRLLASLMLFLVLGLVALPILIQGDGTLPGRIEITIRYALGFALLILSIATLWTACGGMAREIEDKRFYLIASKPIHRYEIWAGKWLAIVTLNGGLLVMVGLTLSGMLTWTLRNSYASESGKNDEICQLLLARRAVLAQTDQKDFETRIERETTAILESGKTPDNMTPAELAVQVRRHLIRMAFSIPPKGSTTLAFSLPADRLPHCDATLILRSAASRPERSPLTIQWQLGHDEHQVLLQTTNYPGTLWKQAIPAAVLSSDQPLKLTLRREKDTDPATLILAPDGHPPELLVPVGQFSMNLTRALLVILCRLAFLAALGLTAGSLLSMPVAVFVSFFVIILLASSGYVETVTHTGAFYIAHEGPQPESTWLDSGVLRMFKGLNTIIGPVQHLNPVPLLAEGRLVAWSMVGWAFLILGLLYTGIIASAGMVLFRKRELG
jgi:ABC-type transport system involved in multi-copper enzyme maturation permease subunit